MANNLETLEGFQELVNTRAMNTEGDNTIVSVNSTYLQGLIDEFGGKKYITSDEASSALPVSNFVIVMSGEQGIYETKLYPITTSAITSAFTADWKSSAKIVILPQSVKTIGTNAFLNATKLEYINLDYIQRLENSALAGTSSLNDATLSRMTTRPSSWAFARSGVKNVYRYTSHTLFGGYDFEDCSKLETIVVSSNTFYQNAFMNCTKLREITFLRLPFNCSQSNIFKNTTSVEKINIPNADLWWSVNFRIGSYSLPHNFINSGKARLYVDGDLVTGMTNPDTITSVGIGQFFSIGVQEITLTSSITQIADYAFAKNNGIEKLYISSSVTTYGAGIVRECTALSSLTIMNDNLELTISRLNDGAGGTFGSGTGTLYFSGNFYTSTNQNYRNIKFKTVHIGGNLRTTTGTSYYAFSETYTEVLKIGGNIEAYQALLGANSALKFFECNGQITNAHANGMFLSPTNNVIVHLGYNGICCTPSQLATATVINNKITKIYVGDGSSQAGDQAVLSQYLADTDWAAYSSKLDLWYNYSGEYKE